MEEYHHFLQCLYEIQKLIQNLLDHIECQIISPVTNDGLSLFFKIYKILYNGVHQKITSDNINDFITGEDSHLLGSNLDLNEELDIKRLKKIRSFRGYRHAMGQPTRGQSTRSHFRTNRKKGVGITKVKVVKPAGVVK